MLPDITSEDTKKDVGLRWSSCLMLVLVAKDGAFPSPSLTQLFKSQKVDACFA